VVTDKTHASQSLGDGSLDAVGRTLDVAVRLWWLGFFVGALLLTSLVLHVVRKRRLARSGIDDIDRVDGLTFEQYLRTAFLRLGYDVEISRYRGDDGADLVVRKDGRTIAVQASRYSRNVGVKAVLAALAAKGHYDADAAMVVTNRFYTTDAKVLARTNDVILWDRERLTSALLGAHAPELPTQPVWQMQPFE
jgi:restriction system protein